MFEPLLTHSCKIWLKYFLLVGNSFVYKNFLILVKIKVKIFTLQIIKGRPKKAIQNKK